MKGIGVFNGKLTHIFLKYNDYGEIFISKYFSESFGGSDISIYLCNRLSELK